VVPLEDGYALVRFDAELSSQAVGVGALVTLLAAVVAALLGGWLGRVLAGDLALATAQVSSLGTEQALRGRALVAGTARFGAVAAVGHAVEDLAERFREFARAHERAIDARESAQRMKELLFASVSHDLKSPLNAVLGFAELVGEEPLTDGQSESLEIVVSRGRELLALIETILDAARVEAGQLELGIEPTDVGKLVRLAVAKSRDLATDTRASLSTELEPDLPRLAVDQPPTGVHGAGWRADGSYPHRVFSHGRLPGGACRAAPG
jgi:signal transduction histidine kinase